MTWRDVRRWLKAAAKPFLFILGILAAAFAVIKGVQIILKAIEGKVSAGQPFSAVPGRPDCIDVIAPWGTVRVQLPEGMTSDKVTAAEVVKGGEARVEVLHEATDRRSMLGSSRANGNG